MRKTGIFFLVIGVFIIGVIHASAQGRNSITGFVFDESRRPVSEVYIELTTDSYSMIGRTRTQGSGMYSFRGLTDGQYYVKVLSIGKDFEEQSQSVSLVPISAVRGRGVATEQVDFYLRPKKHRGDPASAPGVVFAQEVPAEAKSLYEAGVSDLSDKNDAAGLDKIKRSIEVFPDYYLALDRLGNEYVSRGHYEAAHALLTKALTVNPKSFTSTLAAGVAEFRLGQFQLAVDRFKQAVTMYNGSANAHLWLGMALQGVGDLPRALAALKTADKLSGGTVADVHWQLARVYKDRKEYAEAANELELFLKYRPDAQNAGEIKRIIVSLRQKK